MSLKEKKNCKNQKLQSEKQSKMQNWKKIIIQNYNFQNEKAEIEPGSITQEANLIRSQVKFLKNFEQIGFDHINRNAPVLVRSPKLTRFEPAQYWGGRPPGNSVVLNPFSNTKNKFFSSLHCNKSECESRLMKFRFYHYCYLILKFVQSLFLSNRLSNSDSSLHPTKLDLLLEVINYIFYNLFSIM